MPKFIKKLNRVKKTFEDMAEEYDLKLPTVKRIYKEYKED